MSAPRVCLELIVLDAGAARQAELGGADRLEVVSDMAQGASPPSAEAVAAIVRDCRLPAMVMLRPHARSFVYDEADMRAVHESIAMARGAGAHGLVFGALTERGDIDIARLEEVLRWADGMPLTFHRAFDVARDPAEAFGVLGRYRGAVAQVLTSGAASTAEQGAALLEQLVQRWRQGEGVEPLVGSGVHAGNLAALHGRIGAAQYHVGSGARVDGRFDAGIDPERMAALRRAL